MSRTKSIFSRTLAVASVLGLVAFTARQAISTCSCSIGWPTGGSDPTASCDVAAANGTFDIATTDNPNVETNWSSYLCDEWDLIQAASDIGTDNLEDGTPDCDPTSTQVGCTGSQICAGEVATHCFGTLDLQEDAGKNHGIFTLNAVRSGGLSGPLCAGGWNITVKPSGQTCP